MALPCTFSNAATTPNAVGGALLVTGRDPQLRILGVQEYVCTDMSLHVLTGATVATRKLSAPRTEASVKRSGKPLTVYLNDDLSQALATTCERRKVHKSDIVRVAVERLLNDLESGQLELPLGI